MKLDRIHGLALRWPLLLALVMVPVLSLFLAQGALSLQAEGIHVGSIFAAAGSLLVLLGGIGWYMRAHVKRGVHAREVVDMVDASPSWGTLQQQAWREACQHVDGLLTENDKPEALLRHSLSVLRQVASVWNRSGRYVEYSVAVPEALLAAETLAARYRNILLEHVPLVNKIKLSQVLSLLTLYEEHEKKIHLSYQTYRVLRFFSPSGILAELSSLVLGGVSESAKETLLYNLKRAYLQEVANVAIDLYSGNFRKKLDELPVQDDLQRDKERLAQEIGPVRIVIVGQTSSGKSTVVNTLLDSIKAESGLIPTTQSESVYQLTIADSLDAHIIDTPGIESGKASINKTVDRLISADMVIWVMRANQPARSIDQEAFKEFIKRLDKETERQRPAVLVVATHIDRIPAFSTANENSLPDLTDSLAGVCRKSVEFDLFCPVSLKEPQLGVAGFRNSLSSLYDRAINTRINRIRLSRRSLLDESAEELRHLTAGTVAAARLILGVRTKPDTTPTHSSFDS